MENIDFYLGINVKISLVTTPLETLLKVFQFFFLNVIYFNFISDFKYISIKFFLVDCTGSFVPVITI